MNMAKSLKQLASEYAKLVEQINTIEVRKEAMRKVIQNSLEEAGLSSMTLEQGIFTIKPKNEWTFSKKVQRIEVKLAQIKEVEKEKGIAKKKTISTSLHFTPKK